MSLHHSRASKRRGLKMSSLLQQVTPGKDVTPVEAVIYVNRFAIITLKSGWGL
ncbi:MAG: hypothetical protein AB8B64_21635 [Granulosicoccus sp.]